MNGAGNETRTRDPNLGKVKRRSNALNAKGFWGRESNQRNGAMPCVAATYRADVKNPSWAVWALLGIIQCLVVGCANKGEVAWQTAHAIDTLQTLEAVKSPCFREAHPLTKSLIGEHPSSGEVIAWAVGAGMLHAWVSRRLEGRAQTMWQSITLTAKAGAIVHNHRQGVRIGGTEC